MSIPILLTMVYFVTINLITFVVFALDKWKARSHRRRISEKSLLLWSLCGGVGGALVAMEVFHHKLRKGSFLWKYRLISGGWILLAMIALTYFPY